MPRSEDKVTVDLTNDRPSRMRTIEQKLNAAIKDKDRYKLNREIILFRKRYARGLAAHLKERVVLEDKLYYYLSRAVKYASNRELEVFIEEIKSKSTCNLISIMVDSDIVRGEVIVMPNDLDLMSEHYFDNIPILDPVDTSPTIDITYIDDDEALIQSFFT